MRYSLLTLVHAFTDAAVITALPVEHELRGPDVAEQQRMLQWIAFREALHNSNRGLPALEPGEVDQFESLIGDEQDRSATGRTYPQARSSASLGSGGPCTAIVRKIGSDRDLRCLGQAHHSIHFGNRTGAVGMGLPHNGGMYLLRRAVEE